MSEIGAGYYRGQDSHISVGDIVAIVISVTFGLPLLVCVIYLLYVWIRACWHKEEMKRNGTIGEGIFWCWKSSSEVQLNVEELVDAVPAVLPEQAEDSTGQGKGRVADKSGSSTPTESDAGVELTTKRSGTLEASARQQQQRGDTVIQVA